MTKLFLLAAAASLALSACATRPEPVRTVFLSGAPSHHAFHASGGRNVVVIRGRDARGPVFLNGRQIDATRMARLARPDAEALARLRRDAEALGADARRLGELARRQGDAARLQGEAARRQGEAARASGEEIRREAQRLRELCERGQVRCEIIITD